MQLKRVSQVAKVDDQCISVPSIALSKKELSYIGLAFDSDRLSVLYEFSVFNVNNTFILLGD